MYLVHKWISVTRVKNDESLEEKYFFFSGVGGGPYDPARKDRTPYILIRGTSSATVRSERERVRLTNDAKEETKKEYRKKTRERHFLVLRSRQGDRSPFSEKERHIHSLHTHTEKSKDWRERKGGR